MGAKKPGFSYRETSLAMEKQLRVSLLCLWSLKNPVSDPPPERIRGFYCTNTGVMASF
jgi:hypothetical protein